MQHINDDYGGELARGGYVPYMSKRLTTTFTDIMKEQLAKREISNEALHYYLKSNECQQFLDRQKLLSAPQEPKTTVLKIAKPKVKEPSDSVNNTTVGTSNLLEDKSKNHGSADR